MPYKEYTENLYWKLGCNAQQALKAMKHNDVVCKLSEHVSQNSEIELNLR